MGKIPVYILSGFLGSGKTTLLKQLLHTCSEKNINPAVLMNEIGKTDTDGESISTMLKNSHLEKLLDGCMCCNKKDEVTDYLKALLSRKPEVIFIELTGVADPEEVVDSLTEPDLLPLLYLEKVITIVDAENVLAYHSVFESDRELVRTTKKQIYVADYLIINKTDLVSEDKKKKVEKLVRKENATSPSIYTTFSRVDVNDIFFRNRWGGKREALTRIEEINYKKNSSHSFSRIKSISLPLTTQTTTKQIEKFLKRWKPHLLRAKGYLSVKEGIYLMQCVMNRVNWEPSTYNGQCYLVVIGVNLNTKEIKEEWEKNFEIPVNVEK
ncbi:CobW family GTP-binding protein [Bacillus weihaiensis]|uniref:CobW family GTP-binding protein n=1 Tax=Bacillus weihaiensis TaxID=1547283 RepID=UPI0023554EF8|nr:CobW family GTP-binding protein [Bacillus weihaiensis]